LERERFLNLCFIKLAVTILFSLDKGVEAVDQGDTEALFPQKTGNVKETKRFYPKVVCGKICDPGIDKKDMGG
jgi:hypothetical protein